MKRHRWVQLAIATLIVLVALAIWQFTTLRVAHSSFANYAAFRGCATITSQSSASGTCTLADGQTIQIVQFHGRWYLDGDLPTCWNNFCFGLF